MTARRRWAVLVTVALGLLLIALDNSILYTALPTLTAELGASASESLWIINAYPLVMAGLLLGAGTLGDRYGHRRLFLIGLVVFGGASLVAAFSPTPEVLIGSRALLAVGAAAMMPATLALIRLTFTDERERNLAIAVWGSISVVGMALGPIAGGALLSVFWWGSVFLVNVPVVIVAIVAALLLAPADQGEPGRRWDAISSLQAMVGLAGLVVAIKESATVSPSLPLLLGAAVVAIVALGLFARRQRRLPYPLLDFALFRNPAFSSGVIAAAVSMFTIAGVQLATTQRFQLVSGYSPLEAGLLVAVLAVGSLVTGLAGGAFLHRTGLLVPVAGGLAVAVVGALLTTISFDAGLGWLIATFLMTGAGIGAVMAVASTAIVGNAPRHRAGMAASVEEVSYEFGSLTAVALLGSLLTALYTRSIVLPPGVPDQAGASIEDAVSLAQTGTATDAALRSAAADAFDSGYVVVMLVVAGMLALGTIVTAWLLRRHGPGTISATASH